MQGRPHRCDPSRHPPARPSLQSGGPVNPSRTLVVSALLLAAAIAPAHAAATAHPRPTAHAHAAATAHPAAATAATVYDNAPFYTGKPTGAAFEAAQEKRIARAKAAIGRMIAVKGPRTIENTLAPY